MVGRTVPLGADREVGLDRLKRRPPDAHFRLSAKAAARAAETPEAVAEAMQVDWTISVEDA